MEFLSQYGLIILLVLLLIFMFWSQRRRGQRMKAEQEAKARQTVPGARVLLQGGLYGTIVAYDADNLDQPAQVEIAPGTVIEVHSQAILRIVDPVEGVVTEDEFLVAEEHQAEYAEDVEEGLIDSVGDDRARGKGTAHETGTPDDDKPAKD